MRASLENPPVVLQAARSRGVAALVFGGMLLVAGAFELLSQRAPVLGGLAFAAGLAFAFIGLLTIMSPARLELGPDGIEFAGALRTRSFRWDEVDDFRVVRLRRSTLIGFDTPDLSIGGGLLRDLALAISPVALSGSYGAAFPGAWSSLSAESVVDLLNAGRARWGGAPLAQAGPRAGGAVGQRINRRIYWLAVGALAVCAVLLSVLTHGARGLAGGFTLFWIWVYARRLHDIGRSGWWQAAVFACQVAIGAMLVASLHWPMPAIVGAGLLVQLAFTAILGLLPGEPGDNRFGAAPGATAIAAAFS